MELLVCWGHRDASGDPGSFQHGDVVEGRADRMRHGHEERKPPAQGGQFVVLRVPGLTPADVDRLLESKWGFVGPVDHETGLPQPIAEKVRVRGIDFDKLGAGDRVGLEAAGWLHVPAASFHALVTEKA